MSDPSLKPATHEMAERRGALAPGPEEAFRAFSKAVFAGGRWTDAPSS